MTSFYKFFYRSFISIGSLGLVAWFFCYREATLVVILFVLLITLILDDEETKNFLYVILTLVAMWGYWVFPYMQPVGKTMTYMIGASAIASFISFCFLALDRK
ncbi:MAG TPA: hypothetical protein VMR99_00930 [Candidatus Paceibacterota bacterium]|nr:hypothetical protein [Candidatus Paceibacterota bacterium]